MKINKISPDSSIYLQGLSSIVKPVKRLYFIGSLPHTRVPSVAIVGSRKPTAYGREVTEQFASELSRYGVIIISGLALGIDGIAHRAAIDAGGTTVAVLGNSLPKIQPSSHRDLAKDIVAHGGAILSEYEPETPTRPYHFLERNRIVSGLADAVIITEAARRSGTLNTAMHALEQGKDVFVVPGNITSPMSAGCNHLMAQGAIPALSPADVLDQLLPERQQQQTTIPLGKTPEEATIIALLESGIRDGEALQKQSGLAPDLFSSTLTMLEINGIIRPLGANKWRLVS